MTPARRKRPTQLAEALRVLNLLELLAHDFKDRHNRDPNGPEQVELLKVAERIAARTEAA